MAENPVRKLVRLLGGVVLMRGRLGHQILGQMLVLGTHEVAIAGASALVAATTRQRNLLGQIALRTAVPALAVRGLLNDQIQRLQERERRLERREAYITKREIELKQGEMAAAPPIEVAPAPPSEMAPAPLPKPKRSRRTAAPARAEVARPAAAPPRAKRSRPAGDQAAPQRKKTRRKSEPKTPAKRRRRGRSSEKP